MKFQLLVIFTLVLACSSQNYLDNIDYTFAVSLVGQSLAVIKRTVNLALDYLPDQDYGFIKVRDFQLTTLTFGTPVVVKTNQDNVINVAVSYDNTQFGVGVVLGSSFFVESLKSYEISGIKIAYTIQLSQGQTWVPKVSIDKSSLKFDTSQAKGSFKQQFDSEKLKSSEAQNFFSKVNQWFKNTWAKIKTIWVSCKDKPVQAYHKFVEEYMFQLQKEMATRGFLTDAVYEEIDRMIAKTAKIVTENGIQVLRFVEQNIPEVSQLPVRIIDEIVAHQLNDFVKQYPDAELLKSNSKLESQQQQMNRFEAEMFRRGGN